MSSGSSGGWDQGPVEDRLLAERPAPRPAFRGALRRRLVSMSVAGLGRPARLRLLIAAYAGTGVALLLVAIAGTLSVGPFAPG